MSMQIAVSSGAYWSRLKCFFDGEEELGLMDLLSCDIRIHVSSVRLSALSLHLEVSLLLLLLPEEGIDEFLESVLSSALLLEEDEDLKISMSDMAATMEATSPL